MRHLFSTLVLVSILTTAVLAQGQAPAAAPLPTLVAIVDLAELIKKHPDFENKMKALQAEVNATEATFRDTQSKIQVKMKQLEQLSAKFKPGTPEYQKLSDEIASDMAELEKEAKKFQRNSMIKNSSILYDTFTDVKRHIETFSTAKGIAQVTDYRKFEVIPTDPQAVSDDMEQRVVWFDKRLEVTKYIVAQMYAERGMAPPADNPAPVAAGAPVAQPPRQ